MSKLLIKAFVLSITILCVACDKDENEAIFDKDGVAIRLPHLWKNSISDDSDLSETVIATAIVYNGNILVGSRKNNERAILSLRASDGAINWQWNDLLELVSTPGKKDPITIYLEGYHRDEGRLFFTYTGSSYCIDLTNGSTIWKSKQPDRHRFDRNAGIDGTYFTSGSNYDPIDDEKIYEGSVLSAEQEKLLLTPDYNVVNSPPDNAHGKVTQITPFQLNGISYLAFGIENPYIDFTENGWGLTELNLYNLTEAKYQYKKIVVNPSKETRVVYDLIYDESKLYFQSSNFVHGYNAITGVEIWRTRVGSPPLLSSMIISDNRLYTANEDRFLYSLDTQTGDVVWKEQNTGTCSELSYLNGVLYYLGGGDGLLHAVDANTGKHLWKIASPDLAKNSSAWFHGVCVAQPGSGGGGGVIVATTGLHAYAYKAIR